MSNPSLPFGMDRYLPRLDRESPYISLHFIMVFVRDQERSRQFYLEQLGFNLVVDHSFDNGARWIEVGPPDGSANLALVQPSLDSDMYKAIGKDTQIYFLTEDVDAKYREWSSRGVRFDFPPRQPEWGGTFTRFQDVDGNSFGLAGFDELTLSVEAQRRALVERQEQERRAAAEMEIAKQVQARLFPQVHPEAKTLEYAGLCVQARKVGGDYFDFLDLGQQKLGLVIGDVSGKGMAAALLMANLQANLRSQCAIAGNDPGDFLRSVNRLFHQNTIAAAFASLIFAEYDDRTRRLRYVNCGHLSALILRGGETRRLDSTGTLLGLFGDWDCEVAESELLPGDMLALYTDGVTEAGSDTGDEFGEQALVECLRRHRELPCEAALRAITDEVRQFDSRDQHDDITLILGKCRAA